MLRICFGFVFLSLVVAQTELLLQHKDNQSNFTINMSTSGHVSFHWNELWYGVLGSMHCPPAWPTVRIGRSWECDFDTTGTGDVLVTLANSCPNGYIVTASGGGNFTCIPDLDSIRSLGCGPEMIPKRNGSGWYCAIDNDTLRDSVATCSSLLGYPRVTSNNTFSCLPIYHDNDTARDILLSGSCSNGQILKLVGGVWGCHTDNSLLVQNSCPFGETLIWTAASTWVCGWETDTLRDIEPYCNATNPVPVKINATNWGCMPVQTIHNVHPNATVVLSGTVLAFGSGVRTPMGTGYTGFNGLPWSIPYTAIVTTWGIHGYGGGPMNASLYINGTSYSNITSSSTTPFYAEQRGLSLLFSNTTIGVALFNGASSYSAVTVDIYIQTYLD